MEGKAKAIVFVTALICSILLILSQNFGTQGVVEEFFDWSTYLNMYSERIYASFQDSGLVQMIPFLAIFAYFPALAGILGVIASLTFLKAPESGKITFKITGLLAILAFVTFTLFGMIFTFISTQKQFPNLAGAYCCLVPGILLLILSFTIKKPDYMKGHAREDKEYYAIGGEQRGPPVSVSYAPTIACPHCGAMISADQTFCESCGEFL